MADNSQNQKRTFSFQVQLLELLHENKNPVTLFQFS